MTRDTGHVKVEAEMLEKSSHDWDCSHRKSQEGGMGQSPLEVSRRVQYFDCQRILWWDSLRRNLMSLSK